MEAKVACFYRRRELPQSLLTIADQAARQDQICNFIILLYYYSILVSRPRRCLLTNSNHTVASTSNGEFINETKENGINLSIKQEEEGKFNFFVKML